jgi:hypothetical protein
MPSERTNDPISIYFATVTANSKNSAVDGVGTVRSASNPGTIAGVPQEGRALLRVLGQHDRPYPVDRLPRDLQVGLLHTADLLETLESQGLIVVHRGTRETAEINPQLREIIRSEL